MVSVFMLSTNGMQGHDDLCEAFFAYNRAKGTLYDGETRLFLRGSGEPSYLLLDSHITDTCEMTVCYHYSHIDKLNLY